MLNAINEATEGDKAPGATSQTVQGHDHAGQGGVALARNVVALAGNGNSTLFTVAIATASTYEKADGTATGSRTDAGLAILEGYVSPGIDNQADAPSSTPYLSAYVYIYEDQSDTSTVTLRITNESNGFVSAETVLGSGTVKKGWFLIDQIPCDEDAVNGFDLEIKSDKVGVTGDHTIRTLGIIISEVAGVGAVGQSSGSEVLGGGTS